jgi:hypothetical protein
MKPITALLLILLAGCAAHSGVISMGSDTFFISKQAATGFSGASTLKAEVIQEAAQHCASISKELNVINITEAKPPFILGNYPKADIQFKCAGKS